MAYLTCCDSRKIAAGAHRENLVFALKSCWWGGTWNYGMPQDVIQDRVRGQSELPRRAS